MDLTHIHAHPAGLDNGDLLAIKVLNILRFIQEGVGVTTNHKVNSAGSGNKLRISDIAGVVLSIADMRKGYDKITVGAEFIGILLDRRDHVKLRDAVGNVSGQHVLKTA